MGTLLTIVIVIGVVVMIARARVGSPEATTSETSRTPSTPLRDDIDVAVRRDYGRQSPTGSLHKVDRTPKKDHVPPRPARSDLRAWSPRTKQYEVAGEWYRAKDLRKLFERHSSLSESGNEIRIDAVLVPDPANPFDSNAVAVYVDGLHVGYMERGDARLYHRAIAAVPGGHVTVPSRQWLRAAGQDTWARVTLSLPPADQLTCPNPIGGKHVVLPPGSTAQVTREEEHMEHLGALLAQYGSEVVVAAVLRAVSEQRPRSSVELVAVDIDGRQVGVLSAAQTANFMPLVKRAEAEGRQLTCRASLRGNSLKADVALHACKAHELDDEQLEQLFS
jgi:hypothetical protein